MSIIIYDVAALYLENRWYKFKHHIFVVYIGWLHGKISGKMEQGLKIWRNIYDQTIAKPLSGQYVKRGPDCNHGFGGLHFTACTLPG